MSKLKIKIEFVHEEGEEGVGSELSTEYPIEDVENLDKCEELLLNANYEVMRKALVAHMANISKKKAKKKMSHPPVLSE